MAEPIKTAVVELWAVQWRQRKRWRIRVFDDRDEAETFVLWLAARGKESDSWEL